MLLLLPVDAFAGSAAADNWYIRPVATCPNNGDGSAYACAASGGAAGAFSGFNNLNKTVTTGIDDGDTVYVCGSFVQADAETQFTNQAMLAIEESGSSGSVITWTGDCSAAGGSTRATLTSDGTSGSLIRTYANTYITIAGTFDLVGGKDAGMTLYNSAAGDVAISKNIRVESGTTISNIHGGTQEVGITWSGTDGYIGAVTINDIGVDGLFEYSGGNWIIDGARITNVSVDDSNGDCVQLQRNTSGDAVRNLYCDKTNADSKQCVVASTLDSQAYIMEVSDMWCDMKVGTVSIGVYSEGQMTVKRSFIRNAGTYGITGALDNGAKMTAIGNIIVTPTTGCIDVHKTSAGPAADIYNNTCISNGTYGIYAGAATATINIRNNSITGTATNGIYRGASGTSDSYNNVFGPTTLYSDNGVAGSASTGAKSADPLFRDGSLPTTAAGFKLLPSSTLRRAGTELNIGNVQDFGNRAFSHPPSIGAWGFASGDTASSRTTRN